MVSHRLSALIAAAAIAVSLGAMPAVAQVTPGSPTVGPAGGVATTTAPSNSQGTPAGGTGVIGTTRVGPSTAPMASSTTATPRRRHHHRRHARRVAPTTVGTQSGAGLNNSAPASR